ncbi:WD-40 repeat-containing protein [Boletus edulis BED1]|uniref:methylated diphthine methylhydrolase n=1 Tax=Boletus edulis BED1 TaxID=1328754 RepID=A0AAD4GHV3_BOLED|nr:WD-40 repeat-containing protein [Boletus edulis BED1]
MKFNTFWPADSVEFCPHDGSQDVFVCGTYNLESTQESIDDDTEIPPKTIQQRRGKCLVFRLSSADGLPYIDLPAVLDMKWCHRSSASTPVLGIADSEGHISLHEWLAHENRLALLQRLSCAPEDVLCLSIDWSNRRYPTNGLGNLIVSLSDGTLSLLRPCSQGELVVSNNWHAHDHEPWVAAWNYWNNSVIYSGGDDLQMKGWDERQGFDQPIFVNKRFDAGVTTIQSHPHIEHLIAVGSYDSKVRLFDARKPLRPLTDVDVGGGAWRVKWHPSVERKHDLLVACMHDGFKVVRFHASRNGPEESLFAGDTSHEITKRFDQHESLAYGVDWSFRHHQGKGDTLIASCSFYDCALHLWSG